MVAEFACPFAFAMGWKLCPAWGGQIGPLLQMAFFALKQPRTVRGAEKQLLTLLTTLTPTDEGLTVSGIGRRIR